MEPIEIAAAEVPAVEQQELWREIDGFANYSVSNIGRVRNDQTDRVLQPQLSNGYYRVGLRNHGIETKCRVHRLVVQAFIGIIPEGMQCNHIDRIRTHNTVSNLEIVTPSQNQRSKTAYNGRAAEYVDSLPIDAEPLTQAHGRTVAAGYYRRGHDYFVQVGRQYRRLTHSRNHDNGWRVQVISPDGQKITISWTD
jgi:hypothetical protein